MNGDWIAMVLAVVLWSGMWAVLAVLA